MNSKYIHSEECHKKEDAVEIVPIIMNLLNPKSVVDVGCGIGTFTGTFKEHGANVLGIDGKWCNKDLLFKNISPADFKEMDLEKNITLNSKYDLAICLEVAEHLEAKRADSFVYDLTRLSDVVLFSAAIPGQGGQNHINEQWPDYWIKLFDKYGFKSFDNIRPLLWENEKISYWYKQNAFIAINKDLKIKDLEALTESNIWNIVHPELLSTVLSYKDKNAVKRSIKLLLKALSYKFGFQK